MLLKEIGQEMAAPLGKPKPEMLDLGGRQAAPVQVSASFGPTRPFETGAESLLGQLMHLENGGAQLGIGVGVFGALGQWNSTALSQLLQRFIKGDALDFLDKLEDVASLAAAEALVELVVGVDPERGRLLGMERAQADIALGGAYPFQPDVFAHQADNINGSFYLRLEIQSSNNSAGGSAWLGALVSSTQILVKQA